MSQVERKSLQYQYVFFTGVLVVLIVVSILYSRFLVFERHELLEQQRNQATVVLTQTTEIRDHLNTLTSAIDIVMLEPEYKDQIDLVFQASFNEIHSILKRIKANNIIEGLKNNIQLNALEDNIHLLNEYALQLFEIRIDVMKQYPSMAVSEQEILPARDAIVNIFSISINEADEESLNQTNVSAYELLIKGERMWGNVTSIYRLYLANKFGSINEEQLYAQENNVDLFLENMFALSAQLIVKLNNNEYPFETTEQLSTLLRQLTLWRNGFNKVKEIHRSEGWRADTSFMRNIILPMVNEIVANLRGFDKYIHTKNKQYTKNLSDISEQQSFYLVIITFVFVAYSFLVFIFLKKLVFNPLNKFSKNIRSQVFSLDETELMKLAYTQETLVLFESFIDMHKKSVAHRDELSFQAMHDALTGLPNRKALMISLDQNINVTKRDGKCLSFMMLDLNKFKEVNDTLGHHIGDELLIKVGERIMALLRGVDLVARIGGDEFSVVLPGTSKKDAALVALKINQSLKQPFMVEHYSLQVGASIGITEYPRDGKNSKELMQHADVAMYDSKHNQTEFSYYDYEKDSHSVESLALTQDLKAAISAKTLDVYYQPKCEVKTGEPMGSEALLRWLHPEAGFISPEHIIELAEGSGLIDELTLVIIDKALSDHEKLIQLGYPLLVLSINLSVHNLKNEVFIVDVENIIRRHQVDASKIIFEITESAMMADPIQSINMMNRLTQLGVKLSVDDFGTGFSSLAYLKKLPVSELKIDRSFVNDIASDQSDKVIVQSTIELGHNLGLSVVAEGVENEASFKLLQQLKCDNAQGYYFAKPLPFDQFLLWLRKFRVSLRNL